MLNNLIGDTLDANGQGIDYKDLNIGPEFMLKELFTNQNKSKATKKYFKRKKKWDKMANVSTERGQTDYNKICKNLYEFYKEHPQLFRRRVCKGPPPEYRWLAWKVLTGAVNYEVPGAYQELLNKADEFNDEEHPVLNQINLDLNRTYPSHPFYSQHYARIGQRVLRRALRAYAMYNPEVGYTQSINFVMGFILIVNGGRDEEAFWQFIAISNQNNNYGNIKNFEGGVSEFYCDNFPLYCQFAFQFNTLFEQHIPNLKAHFDELFFSSEIYLQKWYMTIFT